MRSRRASDEPNPDRLLEFHGVGTVAVMHSLLLWAFHHARHGGKHEDGDRQKALSLLNAFVRVIPGKAFKFGLNLFGLEKEGATFPKQREGIYPKQFLVLADGNVVMDGHKQDWALVVGIDEGDVPDQMQSMAFVTLLLTMDEKSFGP